MLVLQATKSLCGDHTQTKKRIACICVARQQSDCQSMGFAVSHKWLVHSVSAACGGAVCSHLVLVTFVYVTHCFALTDEDDRAFYGAMA